MRIVLDFETESLCDPKKRGAYLYARHPSTELICVAWQDADKPGDEPGLWYPSFESTEIPYALQAAVVGCQCKLYAFNATFERYIWDYVCVQKYGWPSVPAERWYCIAAVSRYAGYPHSLDDATSAARVTRKDMSGAKDMLALSIIDRRSKAAKENYDEWRSRAGEYCQQDVRAETALLHHLPSFPAKEREAYLLDQQINSFGLHFDRDLLEAGDAIFQQIRQDAATEINRLTNGAVSKPTQVARIKEFIEQQTGHAIDSLNAVALGSMIDDWSMPETCCKILRCRQRAGAAAPAKFRAALDVLGDDDRARDLFYYYGAHTGRWTGRKVQPTNMPRLHFASDAETERAVQILTAPGHALERLREYAENEDPINILTKCVRPSVTARPGHVFAAGDFAGIELRVLTYLAGDERGLETIRTKGSSQLYLDMAEAIFGEPVTKDDTYRYTAGKSARLGLGYQMGASKYISTAKSMYNIDISPQLAEHAVDVYRRENRLVTDMWKSLQRRVKLVTLEGFPMTAHGCRITRDRHWLVITIPSGLSIYYPYCEWNEDARGYDELSYMGLKDHKWQRCKLYGGLITENIVQRFSRDLLVWAMLDIASQGYQIVSHCYDEIVLEVPVSQADTARAALRKAMTTAPHWAQGLPLDADLWISERYRK